MQVVAIAKEHEPIERAERVLRVWAATALAKHPEELAVKEEIKLIGKAMDHNDKDVLARYGEFNVALRRLAALQRLPEAKVTEGVSIDDYSTWRATRFAARDELG